MDNAVKVAGNLLSPDRVIVIFARNKGVSVAGMRGADVDIDIGTIVKETCEKFGGGGGGKPDFGRGSINDLEKIHEAKKFARSELEKALL
jgi:alanyl-tRNA synthetase